MKPYRILLPFSIVYGTIMALRNAFFENRIFRSERLSIPVISVGNMTTGGTGKTPIVELVASMLQERGVRTAIVSRGYGRRSRGLVVVSDGSRLCAEADRSGDEPHQLAHNLPGVIVIVDEDRVRGARHAMNELKAEAVILDDGFQHRRLARTVDCVVLDAEQDVCAMPMLPAGHRREPLSALKRADAFIITKCTAETDAAGITQALRRYNDHAPVVTSSYAPESIVDIRTNQTQSCASVAGLHAVAFCGIGNPDAFRRTCESLGVTIASFHPFADHHRYDEEDFRMLEASARAANAAIVLTTEKDARRIAGRFALDVPRTAYVKMRARISHPEPLEELIGRALGGRG